MNSRSSDSRAGYTLRRTVPLMVLVLLLAACENSALPQNARGVEQMVDTATVTADGDPCVTGVTDRFGAPGPYAVTQYKLLHPSNPPADVTVFAPDAPTSVPRPVIFFSHAYASSDLEIYRLFLERLATHGWIVVHSPYSAAGPFENASTDGTPLGYDQLWDGFEAAVSDYGENLSMDLTRIGFIGHSFGAGATPAMLLRALRLKGWGSVARYAFIMAPYKVFDITPEDFAAIPADTRWLIQVYDDDDTNDHRFAIEDIWAHLQNVPDSNKDYLLLSTASSDSCELPTPHWVPMLEDPRDPAHTGVTADRLDGYDLWAVWRRADALSRCSFERDAEGCAIALGRNDPRQTDMGHWAADDRPVPGIISLIPPEPRNCGPDEDCMFKRD